jgi:hypothetical protein
MSTLHEMAEESRAKELAELRRAAEAVVSECYDVVWKHGHPEAINRLCSLRDTLARPQQPAAAAVVLLDDLDESDTSQHACIHGVPWDDHCRWCELAEYPSDEDGQR